jgi:hypothetical protein
MDSLIIEFPEFKFSKSLNLVPILNSIDIDDDEILEKIKPCNKIVAKMIINDYGVANIKKINFLFKKYENKYTDLREELQKFIEERKLYLETSTRHLK